jgi:hypothetical protein
MAIPLKFCRQIDMKMQSDYYGTHSNDVVIE